MNSSVLVSIVIPAYKPQFFEKALISAMLQDYEHIEIVICDDCRDDSIVSIVERNRSKSRFPIRYFYNETTLLEPGNLARGVSEARGEYVKFLYDDDLLMPNAVRRLLSTLQLHPGAIFASAKRCLVDHNDKRLGESLVTLFPFKQDVVINGQELASFLGQYPFNFIGEPTSVMCRRVDVLEFGAGIMSLNGEVINWLGDVALYLKLLRKGDLVMLAEPLSCFRISTVQSSQIARDAPEVAVAPYAGYYAAVAALGWLRPTAQNRTVKVAELSEPKQFHELNLADYFSSGGVLPMGNDDMQAWTHPSANVTPVKDWLAQRTLTPIQEHLVAQQRQRIAGRASLSVVVLDLKGAGDALETTLRSLDCWAGATTTRLEQHVVSGCAEDGRWVGRLNDILHSSDKDWLLILRAGDELLPGGTLMLDLELASPGDARLIYCDELCRGVPDLNTVFRPALNLDYLLSLPVAMAGHWLLQRAQALQAGGFNPNLPGAVEFDLILRLIEIQGLQGVTHLAEPLLVRDALDATDNPDEVTSLKQHLVRRGYADAQVALGEGGSYRIRYGHPERPLVSIVLSGGYPLPLLQRCLESLLTNTHYPHFEILILDHRMEEASARSWLLSMQDIGGSTVRVIQAAPFAALPAAINEASRQACGDYLLLLDANTAAIRGDWLDELLNHAQRPEVAIVAGKLLSPDGRVQQTGLICGLHGLAGPAFERVENNQAGYMQRLTVDQNFSVVPSSCMLVRKDLYLGVGGMDEGLPAGQLGDIDLCFKIAKSGGLIVWTPHAVLVQEAQQVAPSVQADRDIVSGRWLDLLANDPAYNRNCTLRGRAFELDSRASLNWQPLKWRPLPVVLGYPNASREALESRVVAPFNALREAGLIDGAICDEWLNLAELRRYAPDVVVFQDNLSVLPVDAMREARMLPGCLIVLEVHAFLSTSPSGVQLDPVQRWESLSQAASLADRLIVPTRALADAFAPLHPDVRVLETRLGGEWLDLPFNSEAHQRPRVGCAIESSTSLDPQLLAVVVEALADRVDWVLWGEVPDSLRALAYEVHDGALQQDPQRLVALRLDLALAPLGTGGLDGCRSALPLLQYGACGFGVICSDTPAYDNSLEVTRVSNTPERWVGAIERHLAAPALSRQQAQKLRQQVCQAWMLGVEGAAAWLEGWV